jgi:hypothetical protein
MMDVLYPVGFVAVIWSCFRAVAVVYRLRHGKWPWDHGEWPFED